MNTSVNRVAIGGATWGLAACLLLGLLGISGCSSVPEETTANEPTEQQQALSYTVDMPAIDSEALLADFQTDSNFADYASSVADVQVSIDADARQVDMTVQALTSDTAQLCSIGQAVGQCLSDHAVVTDASGAQASDNGPCGALFEVYNLSVRVEGLALSDGIDGLLHAGDSEIMWQ